MRYWIGLDILKLSLLPTMFPSTLKCNFLSDVYRYLFSLKITSGSKTTNKTTYTRSIFLLNGCFISLYLTVGYFGVCTPNIQNKYIQVILLGKTWEPERNWCLLDKLSNLKCIIRGLALITSVAWTAFGNILICSSQVTLRLPYETSFMGSF